jgi:protein-tyrosine phosphatase
MIDLHAHVLPGVDDGPADMEASVALLRAAIATGTETIVATPHLREDFLDDPARIEPAVARVRDAAAADDVRIDVVAGAEVAGTKLPDLDEEALRTLCLGDGPYILVESPYVHLPRHFADSVVDLEIRGWRPMLAHPERCAAFLEDRSLLRDLVDRGVRCSVTAGSMAGRFGGRVRDMTAWMFAEGLVDNVASDAHDAVKRPPGLRDGFAKLDEMLPGLGEQADWYTRAAPAAMLAGQDLPARPDPPRPRQRSLGRLLGPLRVRSGR